MLSEFLKNFEYNEEQVERGIEMAIEREKNDAPRYNPFYLLQETPELDKALERDLENQKVRKLLRSLQ